jgi:hypothetical protein
LEDKLLRLGVATTRPQAAHLLGEVIRYLLISEQEREREVPLFSLLIDEVWHQFVLFTLPYTRFCERFFGRYHHHHPSESPFVDEAQAGSAPFTFEEFRAIYQAQFGPVPDVWYDELSVVRGTRLYWPAFGMTRRAELQEGQAVLLETGEQSRVLCRASSRALQAMEFIAEERAFYVRELPVLSTREGVLLCRELVRHHLLCLAP